MKSDEKQTAMAMIQSINAVEGFDPTPLAVEYSDMNSGEKRLRLPVKVQIAWFWLKNPDGRIAVSVTPAKDCFVATARIYNHRSDPADQFVSEATASRGYLPDKPSVSPREWAQTAAIGIALRNAGYGLQFGSAGDAFDSPTADEIGGIIWSDGVPGGQADSASSPPAAAIVTPQFVSAAVSAPPPPPREETALERAMSTPCPIAKHKGETLGDLLNEDPGAIVWVANKFKGDPNISAAAKLICERSLAETA